MLHSCATRWLVGVCLLAAAGCAPTPYHYSSFPGLHPAGPTPQTVEVVYGKPNKTLDRLGWIVGLPDRILPMSSKINNHQISQATTDKLKEYLAKNDLTDVYVCVNYYDPRGQWRRLRANKLIRPGWRYTLGSLSMLSYSILPGRIFGGDEYNPYTNSLYINSDVAALVLHEAAYAKDLRGRKAPGMYAAVNDLPVVGLWRETRGLNDVLGYARTEHDWDLERETYHVLYPRMGIETMTSAVAFVPMWWSGPAFGVVGAAAGHTAGRTLAARREKQLGRDAPPEEKSAAEIQLTGH
ncbi:MAG TPA: hypothetical protein VHY20_05215, partial [Pirellulales bacterium]|nr:hypothetical protein [Pirellulales bacterium]